MISWLILMPVVVFGLSFCLLIPVLVRLLRECKADEITTEWLENFSVSSYYPMERLLEDEDFEFLSRQPGFDLSLYQKLRRDRLKIFKQYLNRAIVDFNRLHTAARLAVARSSEDHSEIAMRLITLKFRFSVTVLNAEVSYVLCRVGFRSPAVQAMIKQLEDIRSLAPTPHSAAA